MKRWPLAICLGFCVVFAMNAALIYVAFDGHEQVVDSYANTQDR